MHFPIPHPFAIYDRQHADFALSSHTSYLDNLALVDRTVGEVRRTLERAGLWESTILMVTSDHPCANECGTTGYDWTPEIADLMSRGGSGHCSVYPEAGRASSGGGLRAGGLQRHRRTVERGRALSGNVTTPPQAASTGWRASNARRWRREIALPHGEFARDGEDWRYGDTDDCSALGVTMAGGADLLARRPAQRGSQKSQRADRDQRTVRKTQGFIRADVGLRGFLPRRAGRGQAGK